MEPNTLKIIFCILAFLEAIGLGLIPVLSKSFKENPMVLGIANSFSGGVFLAIAMMHIMPEQAESYSDLVETEDKADFPVPFFLVVCGYTLILVIDKVLFDTSSILGGDDEDSKNSMIVRRSIAQLMGASQHGNVRAS